MAAYSYSAINAEGLQLTGEVHAPDLDAAREQLRVRGLLAEFMEELPASGEDGVRTVFKKIKPKTLQIFSRQFATMIEAGLNVVSSLVILEEQTDDPYFALVIKELRADVEGGLLLSQAMARHPKIFSRLYIAMVEAGEAAGILDQVLDRVALQIEKETQIKRRVKGAMMYPTMVLIFATLVLIGLLMFLVPVFVKIFAQLNGQLPTLTQWVVGASNQLRSHWFIIFPAVGLIIWGVRRFKKTEPGRQLWDRIKLKIPMKIGDVVLKVTMARFS
ncbi:MAG TPA: type II secretion system F family protein, partial [Gaiellaceae bacterium]|nr:type II secretion system F family protein [Gaiellaceae bacterium]